MSKENFTWFDMKCERVPCVDETFKNCFKLDGRGPILGLCRDGEVCNSDATVSSFSFLFRPPIFHRSFKLGNVLSSIKDKMLRV